MRAIARLAQEPLKERVGSRIGHDRPQRRPGVPHGVGAREGGPTCSLTIVLFLCGLMIRRGPWARCRCGWRAAHRPVQSLPASGRPSRDGYSVRRRHFGSRLAREAGLLPMQEREVDMVVTARRQFMPNELPRYSAQLDRVSAQGS